MGVSLVDCCVLLLHHHPAPTQCVHCQLALCVWITKKEEELQEEACPQHAWPDRLMLVPISVRVGGWGSVITSGSLASALKENLLIWLTFHFLLGLQRKGPGLV